VSWIDLVCDACANLATHRVRALLCACGVLTGVAAVIVSGAIGQGAERQAVAEIGALGVDNVIVRAARLDRGVASLSLDDAEELARALPEYAVAAWRSIVETTGSSHVATTVAGVTFAWRATAGLEMASGRWFLPDERARTVVVGSAAAREAFGAGDPEGRVVFAGGEWRTVVGVLADGHAAAGSEGDLSHAILVPFETLDMPLGKGDDGRRASRIVIRAVQGEDVDTLARDVRVRLTQRIDSAAFEIVLPRDLLRARQRSQRTFRAVLIAIGGLSLLIGGVGIANIMLASVTERTAEIGLRRAVGARRSTVMRQFAAEALILSIAGGVAGVPAGAAGAVLIASLAGWPIALTPWGAVSAVVAAAAVGLASGLYPAYAASRLTPMAALHH
jgi:putative ABC transport system permease protein